MTRPLQVDVDTLDVDDALATVDDSPGNMLQTRDVDPALELKRFEAAVELTQKLLPATIKATKSQDWVQMGPRVYLQGTGAERISGLWGLVFGKPKVTREDFPDGAYIYRVEGLVASRRTGVVMHVVGGRSSRDKFFGEDADPMDIQKAAITNWQTRAVSMLCGLRGLTPEDLRKAGLGEVQVVDFKQGSKGGGPKRDTSGVPCVMFGKNKGTPITDLSAKQLDWYISKAEGNLSDESFKYVDSEVKWLAVLNDEKARRELEDQAPPED